MVMASGRSKSYKDGLEGDTLERETGLKRRHISLVLFLRGMLGEPDQFPFYQMPISIASLNYNVTYLIDQFFC